MPIRIGLRPPKDIFVKVKIGDYMVIQHDWGDGYIVPIPFNELIKGTIPLKVLKYRPGKNQDYIEKYFERV